MHALLYVISIALQLYIYVVIAVAVMSWLLAFNVINYHNELVRSIWNAMNALTEPALRPIRRVLPVMGGLDISPVILILIIIFVQQVIYDYLYPLTYGI